MWGETMNLTSLAVKNFSVFSDMEVPLSSGLNVFIGANGTGKTQLLKAIYGCCEQQKDEHGFKKCFKIDEKDCSLRKNKKSKKCIFSIISDSLNCKRYEESFFVNGEMKAVYELLIPESPINAVYIPVKDMLTHSRGLLAMAQKYSDFPFDKTLLDSIDYANRWALKQPPSLTQAILPALESMMGGKINVENDEFYLEKSDGRKVNFELEAEGFKKIGIVWQLLMNESIMNGSILLWDEPEANLNPEFLPVIADVLLQLAHRGVQIFISTHSYVLAKYIEIHELCDDTVQFCSLYKDTSGEAVFEEAAKFSDLKHNAIMASFERLMDAIYDLQVGE